VDLDGDGLTVDSDERGAVDRGEHGDLPETDRSATGVTGGPNRGDLDGDHELRAGVGQ
jgi:hypothetical protein